MSEFDFGSGGGTAATRTRSGRIRAQPKLVHGRVRAEFGLLELVHGRVRAQPEPVPDEFEHNSNLFRTATNTPRLRVKKPCAALARGHDLMRRTRGARLGRAQALRRQRRRPRSLVRASRGGLDCIGARALDAHGVTPTTSCASFTSGSKRRRLPARTRGARAQRAARAACCAAQARLRYSPT